MATKTLTVCDFDEHGDVDELADHQRTFMAGVEHDIDLCDACLPKFEAFQELTQRWVSCSRPREQAPARRAPSRSNADREENTAIREWAQTQPDIDLGERGRIPDSVRQRYRAARAQQNGAAPTESYRPFAAT